MRARNIINVFAAFIFAITTATAVSAQTSGSPTVSHPSSASVSPNLSDLPTAHWAQGQNLKMVPAPKPLPPRGAGPGGTSPHDGALQHEEGPHLPVDSKTKFGGIGASGYIPPDPNIAVGKTDSNGLGYIVQVVNSQMAVFNKSGSLLTGPVSLSSLWTGVSGGCASNNAGDAIAQYDAAADRWLITQLGSAGSAPYSECIAVSTSNDPRGSYYLYTYSFGTSLNDYPKFGVWPTASNSAYLATYNMFANAQTFTGAQLCAYDRAKMLAGASLPTASCFTVANDGNFLPSDLDGTTPLVDGTPGLFLNFETGSSLRLYQLSPNFAVPSSATLSPPSDIAVAPFTQACNGGACIVQPNSQKLDSLADRLMYRLAYRMFGDHASMVVNHSVLAGSSVGVRWYELQAPVATPGATPGAFSLYQQGTFAPDSAYRWMGSAAMDSAGNIAIGYSKSSSSVYPSIAFASRTPGMPAGTMGAETILQAGAGAQTTYNRWGDYTSLRIDPSDDTTFWYTNEYYTRNSPFFNFNWSTAIASFTVGASTSAPDFALSAAQSLTVNRGSNKSTPVTVTAINGTNTVNLSVSGLPQRTSASFSPTAVTPTGTSTLTISANRNAPLGTYTLTIKGSNGSTSHTTQLLLTVQ
jgi:hypothetical protein